MRTRSCSLTADSDFLAQPVLSSDGSHLAWIAWDHPNMPWDTTELRVGRLEDGVVAEWATIAGGTGTAPLQPVWTGEDDLIYSDDPTGRWNLWRLRLTADLHHGPIAPADADTGGAALGTRALAGSGCWTTGASSRCARTATTRWCVIDPDGSARPPLALEATANLVHRGRQRHARARVRLGPARRRALARSTSTTPEPRSASPADRCGWGAEWMPQSRAVTFPGPHGPVHAFDYPPTNPDAQGPDGELPPYVVFVHGGPTDHVGGAASGKIAYLTSRGIGVLDVNYGGSTGYGRGYRERLRGQWGVVDVDDVIGRRARPRRVRARRPAPARHRRRVGRRVDRALRADGVRTSSRAGISRYGVADLRRLAEDTHDFESRYLDTHGRPAARGRGGLRRAVAAVAPRSARPTPLLIEQGLEDRVVPPSQSEAVRDALAANGVPHAYLAFEGEGHGFRRAETVVRTLEAELAFLGQDLRVRDARGPALELD